MSLEILNVATKKANNSISEILSETRKQMADQEALASNVVPSLITVEKYVQTRYSSAIAGKVDQENAMDALSDAMSSLGHHTQKSIRYVFAADAPDEALSDSQCQE